MPLTLNICSNPDPFKVDLHWHCVAPLKKWVFPIFAVFRHCHMDNNNTLFPTLLRRAKTQLFPILFWQELLLLVLPAKTWIKYIQILKDFVRKTLDFNGTLSPYRITGGKTYQDVSLFWIRGSCFPWEMGGYFEQMFFWSHLLITEQTKKENIQARMNELK